jgi:hypothetical protein
MNCHVASPGKAERFVSYVSGLSLSNNTAPFSGVTNQSLDQINVGLAHFLGTGF